jgi:hypothetical protein
MNTNDPKAPYGEKRDPMLSDLQALEVAYPYVEYGGDCSFYGTDALFSIRDFYENLISKGELITKEEHDIDIHNAKMDASEETEDRIRNDHSADV